MAIISSGCCCQGDGTGCPGFTHWILYPTCRTDNGNESSASCKKVSYTVASNAGWQEGDLIGVYAVSGTSLLYLKECYNLTCAADTPPAECSAGNSVDPSCQDPDETYPQDCVDVSNLFAYRRLGTSTTGCNVCCNGDSPCGGSIDDDIPSTSASDGRWGGGFADGTWPCDAEFKYCVGIHQNNIGGNNATNPTDSKCLSVSDVSAAVTNGAVAPQTSLSISSATYKVDTGANVSVSAPLITWENDGALYLRFRLKVTWSEGSYSPSSDCCKTGINCSTVDNCCPCGNSSNPLGTFCQCSTDTPDPSCGVLGGLQILNCCFDTTSCTTYDFCSPKAGHSCTLGDVLHQPGLPIGGCCDGPFSGDTTFQNIVFFRTLKIYVDEGSPNDTNGFLKARTFNPSGNEWRDNDHWHFPPNDAGAYNEPLVDPNLNIYDLQPCSAMRPVATLKTIPKNPSNCSGGCNNFAGTYTYDEYFVSPDEHCHFARYRADDLTPFKPGSSSSCGGCSNGTVDPTKFHRIRYTFTIGTTGEQW